MVRTRDRCAAESVSGSIRARFRSSAMRHSRPLRRAAVSPESRHSFRWGGYGRKRPEVAVQRRFGAPKKPTFNDLAPAAAIGCHM